MTELLRLSAAALDEKIRFAWTGAKSSPFLVEVSLAHDDAARAKSLVRQIPLWVLFTKAPYLAVWTTLRSLSDFYGEGATVYAHIEGVFGRPLQTGPERDAFKSLYRQAARRIGLPVSGNEPTPLFFDPLGPPRARFVDLAQAFVGFAITNGPPAIEDTRAVRGWQRRAVRLYCPGLTRLIGTVDFDLSAHLARRFEAWRKNEGPISQIEKALFETYADAIARYGRKRTDLIGAPSLVWTGDLLGVEAEDSGRVQRLRLPSEQIPLQIRGGAIQGLKAPWPIRLNWECGSVEKEIPFAPQHGEALVFDAESGRLIARIAKTDTNIEVAAEDVVVLAAGGFTTSGFGPSWPAADERFHQSWVKAGEQIYLPDRPALNIAKITETGIWVEGQSVGRSGSHTLYDASGEIMIKIDPGIGGAHRILRARLDDSEEGVRFHTINFNTYGAARVPFSSVGLQRPGDPRQVEFEVLVPGAAGNLDARSELAMKAWVWPGFLQPETGLETLPRPANLDLAHCKGIRAHDLLIEIDPASDVEAPVLGLKDDAGWREFILSKPVERLWHYRLEHDDWQIVPRGRLLTLGFEARHDTLRLRSADRDADLLVLGRRIRRPFFSRRVYPITAEMLEAGDDDRIALQRQSGRTDVLARIRRISNPSRIAVASEGKVVRLSMRLPDQTDAIETIVETWDGASRRGVVALGYRTVDAPALPGITVSRIAGERQIEVAVDLARMPAPGRVLLGIREETTGEVKPLLDSDGCRLAIGVPLLTEQSGSIETIRRLEYLAKFLAEPASIHLDDQLRAALYPAYRQHFDVIGRSRMIRPVLPILNVTQPNGEAPQHDLLGVAPWILEAHPHAYIEISEASGLSPLRGIVQPCPAVGVPDPTSENALLLWLKRLESDPEVPPVLSSERLQLAFRGLRLRTGQQGLKHLVTDRPEAGVLATIAEVWSGDLDSLRAYDWMGGGDMRNVRLAAVLERLARAAARKETSAHMEAISYRTGLEMPLIGQAMTLALRAGIEIFVYFRTLWGSPKDEQTMGERS